MCTTLRAACAAFCLIIFGCSDPPTPEVNIDCSRGIAALEDDISVQCSNDNSTVMNVINAPPDAGPESSVDVPDSPPCVPGDPCAGIGKNGGPSLGVCDKFGLCCTACLQGNGLCAPLAVPTCGEHGEFCYPCFKASQESM